MNLNPKDDAASLFPGAGEMAARCRALDWASTPLGPIRDWPSALRTVVRTALESPFPINLWCGPALTLIYNDAYRPVLGSKHPSALGTPGDQVWSEIWPAIAAWFNDGSHGAAVYQESARFEMDRADGTLGEAFFTFGLSPVRDDDGRIVAYLNPAAETTARILAERELNAAREVAERAERRLREVFAQAPAFLAVLRGPDHVVEFSNDAYQRLVGDRPIVGKPVREALPEVAGQGFIALLDRVYRTGEPFVGREIPVLLSRASDGQSEEVFVDFVYQPLTNAQGEVEGIVAHGSEVTEAVRARQLIEASETRYRFLADAIPVQVWTATVDGQLDYVNQRAESYFAQPSSQLTGPAWEAHVHPDDIDRARTLWSHALTTGDPYQVEFRLRRHDGVYRWHLSRATGQRAADGGLLRWFGTNTDIEAAKQNEAELERLKNEALEANRAKSDFLAAMSHELRTPLNAIGGYAQLIELGVRGPVTPQQAEDLRKIQRSKDHLNTLVGGVLAFAKGGAGRIEIDGTDIRVDALFDSVVDMVQPQLVERDLALHRAGGDAGLVVRGDLDKARQILLNLLANALKFTPAGGTITVRARGAHDVAMLDVHDTGIGIPDEHLERIFEPFMQARRAIQSTDGGVGLGLAISRQLARAMGGDLTVVSPPGEGSTFTLSLPRAG
ncbi:MAG: sensor protein [Gemmatimonadetes bacterium]|jgi:PAS domain S-box-containing protein|nr:sensor protein [Gemmatimonadota bacterium]